MCPLEEHHLQVMNNSLNVALKKFTYFHKKKTGKAYDASKVMVSSIPWGTIGKAVDFTVDASKAGEGNLEITISARGRNIPTQVHPQGSAKFVVSFVPLEGIDHIINITFNKELVPGAPFTAKIHTGKNNLWRSIQ